MNYVSIDLPKLWRPQTHNYFEIVLSSEKLQEGFHMCSSQFFGQNSQFPFDSTLSKLGILLWKISHLLGIDDIYYTLCLTFLHDEPSSEVIAQFIFSFVINQKNVYIFYSQCKIWEIFLDTTILSCPTKFLTDEGGRRRWRGTGSTVGLYQSSKAVKYQKI